MLANLQDIDEKLHMLERQLSDPELVGDQQRYREVVREHSLVAKLAELHAAYSVTCAQIRGNQELVHSEGEDPELLEMARAEIAELKQKKERIEGELRIAHDIQMSILPKMLPPFPNRDEFNLFAVIEPAKEVGGDFYDFFFFFGYDVPNLFFA